MTKSLVLLPQVFRGAEALTFLALGGNGLEELDATLLRGLSALKQLHLQHVRAIVPATVWHTATLTGTPGSCV